MINPPSAQPDSPERKVELDQTVAYAVTILVEKAHLVGWTRLPEHAGEIPLRGCSSRRR
ncbi:hypothetical protein EV128_11317 [Rhizobium azibense]|nr:hypothetical protein EV128_11317 [Rhizobium azibense]